MKKASSRSKSNAKKLKTPQGKKKAKKEDFWGRIVEVTLDSQNAPLEVFGFYASSTGGTCPSTCSAGHKSPTYYMYCC